ncbi:hypothetical protein R5R35_010951 [Gryllus longicercus]|uniref:Epidermal growth factor receptor substrate 15-like 1 n=1 Tax=Gryllus longicercus TaxID=2509291 RepID=A0AAN9VQ17_9ORTH
MAALPSPTQVAGSHNALYEAYYHQVDPSNQGSIGALEAASFLKRSGLSDVILSRVWDLANPTGKGYLNKDGFFVALKLVSLAQSGRDVSMVNITADTPPPKMGDVPPVMAVHNNIMSPPTLNSASTSDWAVKPAEKAKYDQLFDSLQPLNGMIPGNKVKGLLMDSKLPLDTLGKIWDLADMDKDGMLDRHEFMVAMHLVYKALEKYSIPSVLPPELMPPAKIKTSTPAIVPVLPGLVMGIDGTKPPPIPPLPAPVWVVGAEEKQKYDALFQQTDVDKDGFVSGLEIKDVFLQSGVPQAVLALIWTLCDTKQSGKLNCEQFALAMWLISQKLKGIDPPAALTPEMIPPSLRVAPAADAVVDNNNTGYSNPELDMITKDIEELAKEKHILEADIAQKEADIKIKSGEIKSLQSELDTLAATLKQLENQKGEAQKRLTDLKNQVDNLRRQADEQEQTLKVQEDELTSKKQELEGLKQEEANLEQQQKESRNKLDNLTKNLQDTQLQISQAKAKITHLQELHRQMNDAVQLYDTAIESGDATAVPDTTFSINPEFRDPEYAQAPLVNGSNGPEPNPTVNGGDPFSSLNGPLGNEGFDNEDLFKNDPFGSTKPKMDSADPFGSNDPFAAAFSPKPAPNTMGDPFSSLGGSSTGKTDPFDPFDDSTATTAKSPVDAPGKDPFGCDPFALQPTGGGPPPRPESPSPALPPKKSKVPPPRPAPPRPSQGPTMKAAPAPPTPSPDPFSSNDLFDDSGPAVAPAPVPNDPFSSSSGSVGFADFANFDSKFSGPAAGMPRSPAVRTPTQGNTSTSSAQSRYSHLEFTEDPFQNYRYEDPFHIADPFEEEGDQNGNALPVTASPKVRREPTPILASDNSTTNSRVKVKVNGAVGGGVLASGQKGRPAAPLPPEDQQLAWAAAESLRLETERQERLKQEQADLEYALELSRAEKKGL